MTYPLSAWLAAGFLLLHTGPAALRRHRIVVWLASVVIAIGLSWAWSIDARRGANEYQLELSANGL